MNAQRRKAISKIISTLQELQEQVSQLQSEEQDAYDNMPEGLQQGERGQATEEAANQLQEAYDNLDLTIGVLEEAKGGE